MANKTKSYYLGALLISGIALILITLGFVRKGKLKVGKDGK